MAQNIKGITIEIGGDTTKLDKALGEVNSKSRSLQSELKGVNSLLKMDPSNVTLLKQKQDLLNQSIANTKEKLTTLKTAQIQVQEQFDKGEVTEEQYRDFQREIVATEQKLKKLEDAAKEFGSVMAQQISVAGQKVKDLGSKLEDAGKKMSVVSATAAAGLTAATKTAADSESAINKYITAAGLAKEETEKYKTIMEELYAANYGDSIEDIADKMAMVRQNFGDISTTDLQYIVENAYMLQDAFDMDFSETLRGINGLMTNMGLTAEESFDLMTLGAQNGLDKTHELADNIAEYSQIWGQAGFSAQEMFTILDNGLSSGAYNLDKVNDFVKEFTISLADGRIEDNLSSFSKGTGNVFKEWKKGKATAKDVFSSVINDLSNMTNEQDALTLASNTWSALGEDNAMKIITSLNDVNTIYTDTANVAKDANETMYGGASNKAQEALRSIQTSLSSLGAILLPIISKIAAKISALATKISQLNPVTQKIVVIVLAIVAALGPAILIIAKLITAFGTIMTVVPKLVSIIKTIKTAFAAFNATLLANPIVLIVAAIAALIAAFVLLWKKCDWFRNFWINLWNNVKNVCKSVIDGIIGFFTNIINFIKNNWQGLLLFIVNPFAGAFKLLYDNCEGFRNFVDGIIQKIKEIFASIVSFINTSVIEPIKNFFAPIVGWFTDLFMSIYNSLASIINVIWGVIQGLWQMLVVLFTTIITWISENVITPIQTAFSTAIEAIKTAIQTAWEFIKNIFITVGTWVYDNVLTPIMTLLSTVWLWIQENIIMPIKNTFTSAWESLKTGASNAWEGIKNVFSSVATFFGNIFSNAWQKVKNVFATGGKIFEGIKDSIASVFTTVVNKIISGINTVVAVPFKFINKALNKVRNIEFLGISPFKDKWGENPISVPQIPTFRSGGTMIGDGQGIMAEAGSPELITMMNGKAIIRPLTSTDRKQVVSNTTNTGNNTFNFYSPESLTPSECVRKMRKEVQYQKLIHG